MVTEYRLGDCMIKKTFYNLPEEKRKRIIGAVMNEFSSAPAEKISINKIIKAAGISRGSFYQYFDDKVDLVEVLTKAFVKKSEGSTKQALLLSNGDIFYTFENLFDTISEFADDPGQKKVLKNLLKNLKANDDIISEYLVNRFGGLTTIHDISMQFNRENLRFKRDEDIINLTQILIQVLKNAVFNVYVAGMNYQIVRKSYMRKLEIIKAGAADNQT